MKNTQRFIIVNRNSISRGLFRRVSTVLTIILIGTQSGIAQPPIESVENEYVIYAHSNVSSSTYRAQRAVKRIAGSTVQVAEKLSDHAFLVKLVGSLVVRQKALLDLQAAADPSGSSVGIRFVEPNYVYRTQQRSVLPNDPRIDEMWGLHNINAPIAWAQRHDVADVVIAVIDTGIDYTHPDLSSNMWINQKEKNGRIGVDDDGNGVVDDVYGADFSGIRPDGDPFDDNGHGSHVAGTIGAVGNNQLGVSGVVWRAQLMAVKFLQADGSGTTANAIKAIEYARKMGAVITNNSWGGGGFSNALRLTIERSVAEGVLFVAAAGNDGNNIDVIPMYPAAYGSPGILSVAATNAADQLASFSNYGRRNVDIAAPGVDILSTFRSHSYAKLSGTSMATPHVAGVAAWVRKETGTTQPRYLVKEILQHARSRASFEDIVRSGGILDVAPMVRIDIEDRVGVYQNTHFLVDDKNDGYTGEAAVQFGLLNDQGLCGNLFDQNKGEYIAYRQGQWFIDRDRNGFTGETALFGFGGFPQDIALVGDVFGEGKDRPIIFRDGDWFIDRETNGYSGELPYFQFGLPVVDLPVVGDIDGDGRDEIGVFRGGYWYMDVDHNGFNGEQPIVRFGKSGDLPVLADIDGDGRQDPGIFRSGSWYFDLDHNGNNGEGRSPLIEFGIPGDQPIICVD